MHKGMSQEPFARIDRNNAAPSEPNVLCEPAQSKFTWTCHKSHFTQKFIGKMPDPVSCEPAQSKCTWTFHKSHVVEIYRENAGC